MGSPHRLLRSPRPSAPVPLITGAGGIRVLRAETQWTLLRRPLAGPSTLLHFSAVTHPVNTVKAFNKSGFNPPVCDISEWCLIVRRMKCCLLLRIDYTLSLPKHI
jgi:hypothetical protein